MQFYIIQILFIVFLAFCSKMVKNKGITRILFVVSFLFVLIGHAFRDPYSFPDNERYIETFYYCKDCNFKDLLFLPRELGFNLLNFVVVKIYPWHEILYWVISFFIIGIFFKYTWKYSYMPFLSVLIFLCYHTLYYQSLFVLRQHLAQCFIFIALFKYNKSSIKMLCCFVVAFLLHSSAIIFFPYLWFRKLKIKNFFKTMVTIFLLVILFNILIGKVIALFPRFQQYTEVEGNNILPLLLILPLFCIHLLKGNYTQKLQSVDLEILTCLLYGLFVSIIIIGLPGGGRLSNYFMYLLPFAVPMLFKDKQYRITSGAYLIIILVVMIYLQYQLVSSDFFSEYDFYWNNQLNLNIK